MSHEPSGETLRQRNEVYSILTHPDEPRVLMVPEDHVWSLPHFPRTEGWPPTVDDVAPALRSLYRIDAHVLRCVHYHDGAAEGEGEETIYTLESEGVFPAVPDARWVSKPELDTLPLARPRHDEIISAWLSEHVDGSFPPQRPPWQRPGWYEIASEWIRERLAASGVGIEGTIEQIKNWGISCLLRVPTGEGYAYFKALPPLFEREPPVMQALADSHSEYVPSIIASDRERRWLLMRDIGGVPLWKSSLASWKTAAEALARIQIDWGDRVDELLRLGAVDRRLAVLRAQIDPFVEAESGSAGLDPEQFARLRALAPRLKTMCEELAAYELPQTIVHGDFHSGNIMVRGSDIVIYDWTDACVAHPFFDLPVLLEQPREGMPDPASLEEVRDLYLQQWTRSAPIERLRSAFALAEPLAALHQSISYAQIVASLEPGSKRELESGIGGWLKLLLDKLGSSA